MPYPSAFTRRNFLGGATAAVAATALPSRAAQATAGKEAPPAIAALPNLSRPGAAIH